MAQVNLIYYNGFLIPDFAEDYMNTYQEFEVRDDDIYIASFPKSGTTWVQQVVYLLVHGFDYDDPNGKRIDYTVPYMEYHYPGMKNIIARKGLRVLKTHMPYSMLPPAIHKKKGKIITIVRNPKDVAVSFYHFARNMKEIGYNGDIHSYMKEFINDKVAYAPLGKHIDEYWQHRNDENVLFLFYEDMKKDLLSSVIKIAQFLKCDLSEEIAHKITEHCQFDNMEKDPTANYTWWDEEECTFGIGTFMRKGKVGDWKNSLTQEESDSIEEKVKYLEKNGLVFTYD